MPSEAVCGVARRDVALGAKKFAPILTSKQTLSPETSSTLSFKAIVSFHRYRLCLVACSVVWTALFCFFNKMLLVLPEFALLLVFIICRYFVHFHACYKFRRSSQHVLQCSYPATGAILFSLSVPSTTPSSLDQRKRSLCFWMRGSTNT